jgi:hypothetical protein
MNWALTAKPSYARYLFNRTGVTPNSLELNSEMYSLVFKRLKIVLVG